MCIFRADTSGLRVNARPHDAIVGADLQLAVVPVLNRRQIDITRIVFVGIRTAEMDLAVVAGGGSSRSCAIARTTHDEHDDRDDCEHAQ